MTRTLRLVVVCAVMAMLAACGGGGSNEAVESPATPSPTATPEGTASPGPTASAGRTASPGADSGGDCSASRLAIAVPDAGNLPTEVVSIRNEIIQAAMRCDYATLEELAMRPTDSFQYSETEESAGPDAAPAEFWRTREASGEPVLAALVRILVTDPANQPVTEPEGPGSGSEDTYYNFPGDEAPAGAEGYRTSITSTGDWIFFLKS
jgi:hypothetical protein